VSAEAAKSGGGLTEYIEHHLTHNSTLLQGASFHWDSWFISLGLGLIFVLWFGIAARRATAGVPGKGQAFVEIVVEWVETQVKDVFHGDRRFIAPLALTIFMWVLFMNTMDLLPLDLPGWIIGKIWGHEAQHHTYLRMVATADLNTTAAMSLSVFVLTIFYSIKAKGFGGWTVELFTAPFHAEGTLGKIAADHPEHRPQHRRVRVQAGFAGDATVRQHVWRRAGLHAHRRPVQLVAVLPARRVLRLGLVGVPHPDHPAAGLHLHDADRRLHLDGARRALISHFT
jgi:F0F1-type ATP synthase membrane subunit a